MNESEGKTSDLLWSIIVSTEERERERRMNWGRKRFEKYMKMKKKWIGLFLYTTHQHNKFVLSRNPQRKSFPHRAHRESSCGRSPVASSPRTADPFPLPSSSPSISTRSAPRIQIILIPEKNKSLWNSSGFNKKIKGRNAPLFFSTLPLQVGWQCFKEFFKLNTFDVLIRIVFEFNRKHWIVFIKIFF